MRDPLNEICLILTNHLHLLSGHNSDLQHAQSRWVIGTSGNRGKTSQSQTLGTEIGIVSNFRNGGDWFLMTSMHHQDIRSFRLINFLIVRLHKG